MLQPGVALASGGVKKYILNHCLYSTGGKPVRFIPFDMLDLRSNQLEKKNDEVARSGKSEDNSDNPQIKENR